MYLTALLSFLVVVNRWKYPVTTDAATMIRASNPTCWGDSTRFQPVVFRECFEIINHDIIQGYDPDEPLKFSFDASLQPDIQLPKYWIRTGVNCGVGVDLAPGQEGYDRTSLRDIKAAAQAVAIQCVIPPPHAGGFVQLGWHNKLGVLISGRNTFSIHRNGTDLGR
ncbi:MAG: hypothetical protein L6R38_008778 [Xanthoria sp. 2 TBL-2021]|nr:MAG: hypothetical protein L6R38_008778 [Xanthoria sp. 2 TBL-2021]